MAKPSSLEYWHIGDLASLLRRVTPRILSGVKSPGSPARRGRAEAPVSPAATVAPVAAALAARAERKKCRLFMALELRAIRALTAG